MWVARDKDGLKLFINKPERDYDWWISGGYKIPNKLFPDLKWEDEPIEVEIVELRER